jgi:hypothetical protein
LQRKGFCAFRVKESEVPDRAWDTLGTHQVGRVSFLGLHACCLTGRRCAV